MDPRSQSVAEVMEVLAHQTGASPRFLKEVRNIFARQGVELDEPAGPYFEAIVETFERQQKLEAQRARSMAGLERVRRALATWERGQREVIARLLVISEELEARARREGLDPGS